MRIPLDKQTEAIWGKYKLKGSKIEIEALAAGSVWGILCVRLHRGGADPQGQSLLCQCGGGGVALSRCPGSVKWPECPQAGTCSEPGIVHTGLAVRQLWPLSTLWTCGTRRRDGILSIVEG